MITTDVTKKPNWVITAFRLEGSVLLMIWPRILFFCGLTIIITLLYTLDIPIYLQKLGDLTTNVIYNLVLGLLVVFRTNTSYERFWDGRKAWGALVVNIRNLTREIQIGIAEPEDTDPGDKRSALRLLSAFAIATKLHLRGEGMNDDLKALVTPAQAEQLATSSNPPLDIVFWLRRYLQQQLEVGNIRESQVIAANEMLNHLVEGVSSCERIITTPIPIAYRIYLKRLIFIYCVGLPFRIIPDLTWWALPIVAVVSFLLMAVEELGRELENPFGCDANDLPMDDICTGILNNVERTLSLAAEETLPSEKADI